MRFLSLASLGWALVALSMTLYVGLLLVPFVPLPGEGKVGLAAALVVAGEAAFWIGALILGKEVVSRFRRAANPMEWLRKLMSDRRPPG